VIGRDQACQVQVADATVSRRHAKIMLQNGTPFFTNLQTKNGAFVNGTSVEAVQLNRGDEIVVGNCTFIVTQDAPLDASDQSPYAEETITIAGDSAWYLCEDHEQLVRSDHPDNLQNIIALYTFTRALQEANSVHELVDVVLTNVHAAFTPVRAVVALRRLREDPFSFHPSGAVDSKMESFVRRTAESGSGSIFVNRSKSGLAATAIAMTAPMQIGEDCTGVVVVESTAGERVYEEADLHLLVSMAQLAAPYFVSLKTLDDLRNQVAELDHEISRYGRFVGRSKTARSIRQQAFQAAQTALPVLLLGETGTGKELVARMIHEHSDRGEGPFVTVNCAAVPDELFESEMFGYEKGAFTGAHARRAGHFEQAAGGTLFLDEIGELSAANQARILRAVEEGVFHRIGGREPCTVDVRIVSATNLNLDQAMRQKRFRVDLYHRLNTFEIRLPSLRERKSDIPLLANHFFYVFAGDAVRHIEGFSTDCLNWMVQQKWPGNVRELRNAVQRAIAIATAPQITVEDCISSTDRKPAKDMVTLAELEREHICSALELAGGNITAAARMLGVHRNTLYNKINQYDLAAR